MADVQDTSFASPKLSQAEKLAIWRAEKAAEKEKQRQENAKNSKKPWKGTVASRTFKDTTNYVSVPVPSKTGPVTQLAKKAVPAPTSTTGTKKKVSPRKINPQPLKAKPVTGRKPWGSSKNASPNATREERLSKWKEQQRRSKPSPIKKSLADCDHPECKDDLYEAELAMRMGKYKEAKKTFDELAAETPMITETAHYWVSRAQLEEEYGHYGAVVELFEQATEKGAAPIADVQKGLREFLIRMQEKGSDEGVSGNKKKKVVHPIERVQAALAKIEAAIPKSPPVVVPMVAPVFEDEATEGGDSVAAVPKTPISRISKTPAKTPGTAKIKSFTPKSLFKSRAITRANDNDGGDDDDDDGESTKPRRVMINEMENTMHSPEQLGSVVTYVQVKTPKRIKAVTGEDTAVTSVRRSTRHTPSKHVFDVNVQEMLEESNFNYQPNIALTSVQQQSETGHGQEVWNLTDGVGDKGAIENTNWLTAADLDDLFADEDGIKTDGSHNPFGTAEDEIVQFKKQVKSVAAALGQADTIANDSPASHRYSSASDASDATVELNPVDPFLSKPAERVNVTDISPGKELAVTPHGKRQTPRISSSMTMVAGMRVHGDSFSSTDEAEIVTPDEEQPVPRRSSRRASAFAGTPTIR